MTDKEEILENNVESRALLITVAKESGVCFVIATITFIFFSLMIVLIDGVGIFDAPQKMVDTFLNKYQSLFLISSAIIVTAYMLFLSPMNKTKVKLREKISDRIKYLEGVFYLYFIGICFHLKVMPFGIEKSYLNVVLFALLSVFLILILKLFFKRDTAYSNFQFEGMICMLFVVVITSSIVLVNY
ncbi:hypothetical protein [Thalassotalea atypica]|uniref:hypothetical protein n=1 Tax=Thalassotalea atypica TaxID=2054316 RepID=UPI002573061D|nr:hypothetical protein [Thalassotalea atypica]